MELRELQWRDITHSQKLQHYWNLTIRLFSVVSTAFIVGGILTLSQEAVGVFCYLVKYTELFVKRILFQTIQFSISLNVSLNVKTVIFQAIQYGTSLQFRSIWPIDRTLSGATTLSQSGPASEGNEELLHIPQSSSITGTSPLDF